MCRKLRRCYILIRQDIVEKVKADSNQKEKEQRCFSFVFVKCTKTFENLSEESFWLV